MFAILFPSKKLQSNFAFKENFKSIFIRDSRGYDAADGFRALTICVLVFFHCIFGLLRVLQGDEVNKFIANVPPYWNWAWQARGSDLMFVLCGFLLGLILIRELKRKETINIGRFYYRRFMRIMPLFFVALVIYTLLDYADGGHAVKYFLSNLLFITNLVPGEKNIIPVGWSLVVQVQFYFFVPFLILLLYKTPYRFVLLFGLMLALTLLRYIILVNEPQLYETRLIDYVMLNVDTDLYTSQLYYNLYTRAGPLILGVILAYINADYGEQLKRFFERHISLDILTVVVGAALVIYAVSPGIHNPAAPINAEFTPAYNLFYFTTNRNIFGLGIMLLLMAAFHGGALGAWLNKFLSLKIWYPISQLIYPIYLFHFPFIVIAAVIVFQTTDRAAIIDVTVLHVIALFLVSMLLTIIFSIFAYLFIEKPLLNMRAK